MKKPPKKALLHGCYDNRNFGDVLMADMLTAYLRKQHQVEVYCPGMLPDVAQKLSCTPCGNVMTPWSSDVGVFGGGGYLHGSSPRHIKRLLRYAIPAFSMRRSGAPYVIVGVGAGPKISRFSGTLIRNLCNGAAAVAVREPQSFELLQSIGVKRQKLELTADLVAGLRQSDIPEAAITEADQLLKSTTIASLPRRLCIHLSVTPDQTHLLHNILKNIRQGLGSDQNTAVYWLQDHGNRTLEYQKIADQYLTTCKVLPPVSHWTLAAVISKMETVLTTKLHASIAAWALGKPICGFSNHQKTARFFGQIDRAQYQCMHDDDPSIVADWTAAFVGQDDQFFQDCGNAREQLTRDSLRNLRIIDEQLFS